MLYNCLIGIYVTLNDNAIVGIIKYLMFSVCARQPPFDGPMLVLKFKNLVATPSVVAENTDRRLRWPEASEWVNYSCIGGN